VAARKRKRSRRPGIGTLARRWSVIAVVAAVGYFYYHPLRAYLSARHEFGARRAEVGRLSTQKRDLERRVNASTSLDVLAREARKLGYVRPGEHLYIVKGIAVWRRAQSTIARHGK
jgi:cell division protein FtsB